MSSAYVADSYGELKIFDIAIPTTPVFYWVLMPPSPLYRLVLSLEITLTWQLPKMAGLNNSDGAAGYFIMDTTKLQPGPGFIGTYDFIFVKENKGRPIIVKRLAVNITVK